MTTLQKIQNQALKLSIADRCRLVQLLLESLQRDDFEIVEDIHQQKQAFQALLQKLGETSSDRIASILAEREIVAPEEELTPEIITRVQQRIRDASRS